MRRRSMRKGRFPFWWGNVLLCIVSLLYFTACGDTTQDFTTSLYGSCYSRACLQAADFSNGSGLSSMVTSGVWEELI